MTPCEEDSAASSAVLRSAVVTRPATVVRSGPGPGPGRNAAGARTAPAPPGAAGALVRDLRPLVAAEASAEAHGEALDSGDLEQSVWLRLLERLDAEGPPADAAAWVAGAVRDEARGARRRARRARPSG
ncbi:hypothetical protein ABTX79_36350, partial [Streptomyces sp. NPDC096153]